MWEKDQKTFASVDVLDTIRFKGQEIYSWIFTSSLGTVKSKSKLNRNYSAVLERCTSSGNLNAHYYSQGKWYCLPSTKFIDEIFHGSNSHRVECILSLGAINGGATFETFYESSNDLQSQPKFTTFCFLSERAKGRAGGTDKRESGAIPSERVLSLNKNVNRRLKDKISIIVRLIEERQRIVVIRLKCVFLLDDNGKR